MQSEVRSKENKRKRRLTGQKPILREETASVGSQKATVHVEKHAHSSMTRTRNAKGRDDRVHFFGQVHRTEIRKVTER